MGSFIISAMPLFLWWRRIRFSCPLDLVVRSFGLGLFAMFWVVMMLFYLSSHDAVGRLLLTMFGNKVGVAVRLMRKNTAACARYSIYLPFYV